MPLLALAVGVPPLIERQGPHRQRDAVVHEHHKQAREDGDDAQPDGSQVGVGKADASIAICHLHSPGTTWAQLAQHGHNQHNMGTIRVAVAASVHTPNIALA